MMVSVILIILLGYFAGSIPTAVWTSRVLLKDDIRNYGSHNAGATNVYRVMGWRPALFVVLVDMIKGVMAVLLISKIRVGAIPFSALYCQILAGVAAILGHIWTAFAQFRGGKGVGTAFGVLIALIPVPALIALGIWILLVLTTRIVSVGSIFAALSLPVSILIQRRLNISVPDLFLWISILLAALILFTHRSNIGRLIRGKENRFGVPSKPESSA
jgi:glycerol-3-phosphate acyltransferase PlsY